MRTLVDSFFSFLFFISFRAFIGYFCSMAKTTNHRQETITVVIVNGLKRACTATAAAAQFFTYKFSFVASMFCSELYFNLPQSRLRCWFSQCRMHVMVVTSPASIKCKLQSGLAQRHRQRVCAPAQRHTLWSQ